MSTSRAASALWQGRPASRRTLPADDQSADWEFTTAGHRASLNRSKNATEPGAVEEQWNLKLSKAELRSNDDEKATQRASEKPCEPIPEQDDRGGRAGPEGTP